MEAVANPNASTISLSNPTTNNSSTQVFLDGLSI